MTLVAIWQPLDPDQAPMRRRKVATTRSRRSPLNRPTTLKPYGLPVFTVPAELRASTDLQAIRTC
jgi:hypothetical protein